MLSTNKTQVGKIGESVAVEFLIKRGFNIIDTNYREKCGEIDIIASKDDVYRFIEVKTSDSRGTVGNSPEERVHEAKLRKIQKTLEIWLLKYGSDRYDFQIDVVAVVLNRETRRAKCTFFEAVL